MGSPQDNPLRYQENDVPPQRSLPIEDWRRPVISNEPPVTYIPPQLDPQEVMHALEQIKAEMRTLLSEVSVMAQELANVRRLIDMPPRRY